jgi:dCTP deaminase
MSKRSPWDGIQTGTLTDGDIIRLASAGELITKGFDANFVKQACYELRTSEVFWDVASDAENKRVVVKSGRGYLLKPNCCVVCIVAEHIHLPSNVLARILTKGRLFSIGILPLNTYADPGFAGRLGITLFNSSKRYILLKPGEPVAKVEFTLLPRAVDQPYRGQHGYETEIWPIASHLFADIEDPAIAELIRSPAEELEASYGTEVGRMYREIQIYSRVVWLQLLAIIIGFSVLIAVHDRVDLVSSLILGIFANFITTIGTNLCVSRRR